MGKVVVEAERLEGEWPVLVWEATRVEETPSPLDDRTIGAFDNTVVLVTIGVGLVMSDAFVFARRMQLQGSIAVPMMDFVGALEVLDAPQDVLR